MGPGVFLGGVSMCHSIDRLPKVRILNFGRWLSRINFTW